MRFGLGFLFAPASAPPVTPGSQTFNSGSGNFTVPAYNTLTIELWGQGGGGAGGSTNASQDGQVGAASTVSTYSLTANGGSGGVHFFGGAGGSGGSASGGNDTNTSGSAGGNAGFTSNSTSANNLGPGGASPNGGASRPCPTNTALGQFPGNDGNAPGGGGSGYRSNTSGPNYNVAAGGGGGGYVKHVFTFGAGAAPAVGASIAYSVGTSGGVGGQTFSGDKGGNGANGRVKFTWS